MNTVDRKVPNHMPVIGTAGAWCIYMDEEVPDGKVGHKCFDFDAYRITSSYYLTQEGKVRFTCKRCEGCGAAFSDDIAEFIYMMS